MSKTQKELNSLYNKSKNCFWDCYKNIYESPPEKKKKRNKCSLKRRKTGINFKVCLKSENIDYKKDELELSKCKKSKCNKLTKIYETYNKEFKAQKLKKHNTKSSKNSNKCCKCCGGRYWGNSYDCINFLPCCKGVSNCKKRKTKKKSKK